MMKPMDKYSELAEKLNRLVDEAMDEYAKRRRMATGAVTPLPLLVGRPLILGINWGGGDGAKLTGTVEDFDENFGEYSFIKSLKAYQVYGKKVTDLLDLGFDPPNFNYSNLCLLRTAKESHLLEWEIEMSKNIVLELVDYLNPPFIILLGAGQKDRLVRWLGERPVLSKTLFVYHPQARVSISTRAANWEIELKKLIKI